MSRYSVRLFFPYPPLFPTAERSLIISLPPLCAGRKGYSSCLFSVQRSLLAFCLSLSIPSNPLRFFRSCREEMILRGLSANWRLINHMERDYIIAGSYRVFSLRNYRCLPPLLAKLALSRRQSQRPHRSSPCPFASSLRVHRRSYARCVFAAGRTTSPSAPGV